jgi:hypothetical protein
MFGDDVRMDKMNSLSTYDRATPQTFDTLPSEVADGIAEMVASPPDASARATAIVSLIQEIVETMQWVHGPQTESAELVSLRGLMAAALEHQERMAQPSG